MTVISEGKWRTQIEKQKRPRLWSGCIKTETKKQLAPENVIERMVMNAVERQPFLSQVARTLSRVAIAKPPVRATSIGQMGSAQIWYTFSRPLWPSKIKKSRPTEGDIVTRRPGIEGHVEELQVVGIVPEHGGI